VGLQKALNLYPETNRYTREQKGKLKTFDVIYVHLDLGAQALKRRRQVDGDALQVLAPEARPCNPALLGRAGAVLVVAGFLVSKNRLRRRR